MDKKQDDFKIEIKVDDAAAGGHFANFCNISHSPDEFIVDYLFINPSPPPGFGKLVSRIILTPGHAKRILMALTDNIRKYEERFGDIKAAPLPEGTLKSIQ